MTAPAAAPVTPPAVDPKRQPVVEQGTEYIILAEAPAAPTNGTTSVKPGTWIKVGLVTARDTDKAIEKFSSDHNNQAGTFVAIPASRWKPVKVTPQTVTTLKLEEAK